MPHMNKFNPRRDIPRIQEKVKAFTQFTHQLFQGEPLEEYLEATRAHADGTLDPLAAQVLSIAELKQAQHNLRHIRAMCSIADQAIQETEKYMKEVNERSGLLAKAQG